MWHWLLLQKVGPRIGIRVCKLIGDELLENCTQEHSSKVCPEIHKDRLKSNKVRRTKLNFLVNTHFYHQFASRATSSLSQRPWKQSSNTTTTQNVRIVVAIVNPFPHQLWLWRQGLPLIDHAFSDQIIPHQRQRHCLFVHLIFVH